MVFTVEEKLAKLQEFPNWFSFTAPQRHFVEGMARGMKPEDAYAEAYPDTKALLPQTAQMLCRAGIKKALASIGIDTRKPIVAKSEAMELLSRHLRKTDDPNVLVKLLGMYSKIAGWEKKADEEDQEIPLDKLVSAVEKRRHAAEVKEDEQSK